MYKLIYTNLNLWYVNSDKKSVYFISSFIFKYITLFTIIFHHCISLLTMTGTHSVNKVTLPINFPTAPFINSKISSTLYRKLLICFEFNRKIRISMRYFNYCLSNFIFILDQLYGCEDDSKFYWGQYTCYRLNSQ